MILDIIIIGLIALCVFAGYKRGLVKVIFKVFAFLVAIIVTFMLYRPITNLVINNTQIDEKIESIIIENGTVKDKETTSENVTTEEQNTISNYIDKYVQNTTKDAQNGVVTSAAGTIAVNVVGISVMILLFIIVRILLNLVKFLVDTLADLPIIKQFNHLGGIIYGLIEGLLISYIMLAIMFFVVSVNGGTNILNMIQTSTVAEMMYNNNIILNVLFK